MKAITIRVDDETYYLYQHRADAAGISLAEWVEARLGEAVPRRASEAEFERLRKLQDEALKRIRTENPGFQAGDNLSRDELYNRDAFR